MEEKVSDEKRFNAEDLEYYIDPSNIPKDLLRSLRELKSSEFKKVETLFTKLVNMLQAKADVAKQWSSSASSVEYLISTIQDEEVEAFLKHVENKVDNNETKTLSEPCPREKLREIITKDEDARKSVAHDFSEVQRRKVIMRSTLEQWYGSNSTLSQIYEPVQNYLKDRKTNLDLETFSKWLRNVRDYFTRRKRSMQRLKRRQNTRYKDDCDVSIRDVLREALDSIRKMKSKWSELYVREQEKRELLNAFQVVELFNRADILDCKRSKFQEKMLKMNVTSIPLVMYLIQMRTKPQTLYKVLGIDPELVQGQLQSLHDL